MSRSSLEKSKDRYKQEPAVSVPRLLDPTSTVDSIVTKALEASTRKLGLADSEACLDCLKRCEYPAFNYYCYYLARELGEVLGSWSNNIKAIYACSYDEAVNGEDSCEKSTAFLLIHIIILVAQKKKALDVLMDAIDRAMVQRHQQMLGLKKLKHALDAQVIDDADIKNRTGYAALLRSVYQPPIRVWQNSPDI